MLIQLLMPTTDNKQAPDFMQEKVSIEMLKYRNKQNDHSLSNHKERHREIHKIQTFFESTQEKKKKNKNSPITSFGVPTHRRNFKSWCQMHPSIILFLLIRTTQ